MPDELVPSCMPTASPAELALRRRLLITAGPTREAIDPVRYISNHSSGKMGFALAEPPPRPAPTVTLVSGPVHLPTPAGVRASMW